MIRYLCLSPCGAPWRRLRADLVEVYHLITVYHLIEVHHLVELYHLVKVYQLFALRLIFKNPLNLPLLLVSVGSSQVVGCQHTVRQWVVEWVVVVGCQQMSSQAKLA